MRIKSFKFNGEGKVLIWCCFDIRRVMGAIVRTYQIIMGRAYYKCTLGFSSTSNVTDTKKTTTTNGAPFLVDYCCVLLFQPCVILADIYGIQRPPTPNWKHRRPHIDEQTRTNERTSKYTAPPNPQGDRPRSMRSLAALLPYWLAAGLQDMVFPVSS